MTGCNGIDVSNNNGKLDLTHGFSGLDFVIAKATEGLNFADDTYDWYMQQAIDAGVLFHAYHFGHPELLSGRSEAEHFMSMALPQSARGLWYDYEPNANGVWPGDSPQADAETIDLFADTIRVVHPHARIGVYSSPEGFARILPYSPQINAKWCVFMNNQLETPTSPMPPGSSWNVHQYETFAGIDRNYSRWTKDEMRQYFGNWPAA